MTEQLKVYHNKPLIFTIDNILTAEECNYREVQGQTGACPNWDR